MTVFTQYSLPFPYAAYSYHERFMLNEFESYKSKIYGWVQQNTSVLDVEKVKERINSCFTYINDTNGIRQWLIVHADKVRYIYDFSGLEFGVSVYEEFEKVQLCFPKYIKEIDWPLYDNYDETEFLKKNTLEMLDWMYEHCEFIPFRNIYERIGNGDSHKFSHIKRDDYVMRQLDAYLNSVSHQPNDDIYYFIKYSYDEKGSRYYLKRDIKKSPRKGL